MSTLKVGDKVQLVQDIDGFKNGQVVEVFMLYADGQHLFKGANTRFAHCNGQEGAWLHSRYYTVLTGAQANADLLLKYAMIAQYDDKPWEQFEYLASDGEWVAKSERSPFRSGSQYRLKPQPTVVRVGQTWVSSGNGIEVTVDDDNYMRPNPRFNQKRQVRCTVVLDDSINLKTTLIMDHSKLIRDFKRKG